MVTMALRVRAAARQELGVSHFELENCRSLALLWHFMIGDACEQLLTVRASQRWRPCEEVQNGLPDGRHARLRWWPADSFFSVPLP